MVVDVKGETEEGLVVETKEDLDQWEKKIDQELEEVYNLWIEKGGITEEVDKCPLGLEKCIRLGCEFFNIIGNDRGEKSRLGCNSLDSVMRDVCDVSEEEFRLLQKQSALDELKAHLG